MINEAMDQVAEQFGTVHFDAAADLAAYDRRMWSADRLHPSERGHRYIAGRFHDQLAAGGHAPRPAPGRRADQPAADAARHGGLDGDQGHRLGAAPMYRPRALPACHGATRMLARPWPAASGACPRCCCQNR